LAGHYKAPKTVSCRGEGERIMAYTMVAHPTEYNGVRFRSRLEARWAAFFDILGWRWDYEPYDFHGWVPDFQLHLTPWTEGEDGYYGTKYVRDPHPFVEIRPVAAHEWNWPDIPKGFDVSRIYRALKYGDFDGEVFLLGSDVESTGRIPDLGCWDQALAILAHKTDDWKLAGNKVQWRG
jgi:hypothetical protein